MRTIQPPAPKLGVIISYPKRFISNLSSSLVRGGVSLIAIGESHLEAAALVLVDMTPQMEAAGARRIQAFMNQKPEGFDTLQEVADAMDRADTGGPLCAIRGYDGSLAAGTLALIHCQHLLRRAEQARG